MRYIYLLTLILILASLLLAQWRQVRAKRLTVDGAVFPGCQPSPRMLMLTMAMILGVVAIPFAAVMVISRESVFDDAFISYRYAWNLAHGHGLRWNPGEAPVEGYTNFLLIVLLAPLVRLGVDPLRATQALSVLCAAGLAYLLSRAARRHEGLDRRVAWLSGLAFLPASTTFDLCTSGMETVVYAFVLFGAALLGAEYLRTRASRTLVPFGVAAFAAGLLRPEGVLLVPVVMAAAAITSTRGLWRELWGMLPGLTASFLVPGLVYLVWKQVYFGCLLPNPFFVKMSHASLLSPSGLRSVTLFLGDHWKLLVLSLLSLFMTRRNTPLALVSGMVLAVYTLFYLQVDTLMDVYGRFLYPMAPFLFCLALPVIGRLFRIMLGWRETNLLKLPAIATVFFLVFFLDPPAAALNTWLAAHGHIRHARFDSLMKREYRLARSLSEYPKIGLVTLASGDAGVIPYFTRAPHLDIVGLTDGFIARERSRAKLLDYFFGRKPTLVFLPANKDHTWTPYCDGPLGNYASWARDERWDDYAYAGTVITHGTYYDVQLLLRKDYADFPALAAFLQERVADVYYTPFPLPLGTYQPLESP